MILLTSWDDGHPSDLRIADLLRKHGLEGTFFVPKRNIEGRSVMNESELRSLDRDFELGGHTLDHIYLNQLNPDESYRQIFDGKNWLEGVVGHRISGFCYPGGKRNRRIAMQVNQAGFQYARTIENFRIDSKFDKMAVPTSLQFFEHKSITLWRNLVRFGAYRKRALAALCCVGSHDFATRLDNLIQLVERSGGVLHIWGHSWEIDEYNLWRQLDEFLGVLGRVAASSYSVGDFILGAMPGGLSNGQ
jgi:peptidoglycan/xylan/chitin deacetylase (PgdA/CDA1 family)